MRSKGAKQSCRRRETAQEDETEHDGGDCDDEPERGIEPRSHLPEEPQNRCPGPGYLTRRQGTRIMLRLIAQSLPPRVLPNL